jgi:adenosylhomocysteine nucleosidase
LSPLRVPGGFPAGRGHSATTAPSAAGAKPTKSAGYLVAGQAYFDVTPVTKVVYTAASGKQVTLTDRALSNLTKEYKYNAAHP